VTVNLADTAVRVQAGTLDIDDSILDLGTGGTAGLVARPISASASATVNANQLTVVGGGAGSKGAVADASDAGTDQSAAITVDNSIVRGPATSLATVAGTAGETSSAHIGHSDYQTVSPGVSDDGGNLVGADPLFIDPAAGNYDYDLRAGSPVIDKAVVSTATLDVAGRTRTIDGDGVAGAAPDMGAYELHDVTPPNTTITAGPSGATNDNTPLFTFRSGADATFQCRIDGSGPQPCTSPVTTTPLSDGPHSFTVQAFDDVFNPEVNPPSRTFTVDTTAPDTLFTKKPQKRFFKAKVKFKFTSHEAGVRFQCMLDNLPWRNCSSPYRYDVKIGRHRLMVRALDAAGNVDATPARYTFRRVARPRHHHPHHHR
jgi:hypothetical protein